MTTHDQNAQKQAQEQKRAEALRANLKRRKAQQQQQQHAQQQPEAADAKTGV